MNVLVIVLDDMSTDEWGALPYLRSEPYDHWVTFPNWIMSTPVCGPSRASMLTGLAAHHHGVLFNQNGNLLDTSYLLPKWLQDAGFVTGLIGKYLNGYPFDATTAPPIGGAPNPPNPASVPPGWTEWFGYVYSQSYQDFWVRFTDGSDHAYPYSGPSPEVNYATDVLTARAISFIDAHAFGASPWFLFLTNVSPHRGETGVHGSTNDYPVPAARHAASWPGLAPLRPASWNNVGGKPQWMQDAYGGSGKNLATTWSFVRDAMDAERLRSWRTLLAADEGMQTIFTHLQAIGQLDNTAILVVSDNGFCHGQYRHSGKLVPYDPSCRSTLMARHPNAESHSEPFVIGNVDLASTVCQFAGVRPPPLDGEGFAGLIDPSLPRPHRQAHLVELRHAGGSDPPSITGLGTTTVKPYWALRTSNYTYIEWDPYVALNGQTYAEVELYQNKLDPNQLTNVAAVPQYLNHRAALATLLAKMKVRDPFRQFPPD